MLILSVILWVNDYDCRDGQLSYTMKSANKCTCKFYRALETWTLGLGVRGFSGAAFSLTICICSPPKAAALASASAPRKTAAANLAHKNP